MDLYTVLQPQKPHSSNYSLHLLELNDELLDILKNQNEPLFLKSTTSKTAPVLVTSNKTFKIRLQNNSNCVMLLSDRAEADTDTAAVSLQQFENQYVLSEVKDPETDLVLLSRIPILRSTDHIQQQLRGQPEDSTQDNGNIARNITKDELFQNCSMSSQQFNQFLLSNNVVNVNKQGCLRVKDELILSALWKLIHYSITYFLDVKQALDVMKEFELITLTKPELMAIIKDLLVKSNDGDHPQTQDDEREVLLQIIEFCFDKYMKPTTDGCFQLNNELVVKSFGLIELINLGSESIKTDDFIINLKLKFPFNYNPDIELSHTLKGNFYHLEANKRFIKYLDESTLSLDVGKRLGELFRLKSAWEVKELEPFVRRVNVKHLKIEKFLLKFCRVKKEGKKHMVYKR